MDLSGIGYDLAVSSCERNDGISVYIKTWNLEFDSLK
jgi:hypothetical protein